MEIKKTRIYGDIVEINKKEVKSFWNKRAQKYTDDNPYNAVKCNDNNPEYVHTLEEYERNYIIPQIKIDSNSKVLDIGCGIGRLADVIVPQSKYYLGTDFAEELLKIAKNRINPSYNFDFEVCDFINISKNECVQKNKLFNKVILAGVTMYINDQELKICLENLLEIIDKNATIYISSPIAIDERLTLEGFYSENLNSEYNVIYRTVNEYLNTFKVLIEHGFKVTKNEHFLNDMKQYPETERHYFILER